MARRYVGPGWFTRNVFNRVAAGLTRVGISVGLAGAGGGGRKSGEPRRVPVNVLTVEGSGSWWLRVVRPSGCGTCGSRVRACSCSAGGATALRLGDADADKVPILRAYLKRWTWEVGVFFGGVEADSPGEELRQIAADHPIFHIETLEAEPNS